MAENVPGNGGPQGMAAQFSGPWSNKRRLAGIAILLLLALWAGYLFVRSHNIHLFGSRSRVNFCSSDILNQAGPVLTDTTKTAQLKSIVDQIQTVKNYEKNADCLYVVTQYYANISDLTNAQKYDNKLNNIYDPKKGLSKTLVAYGANVETLNNRIAAINQYQQSLQKNTMGVR